MYRLPGRAVELTFLKMQALGNDFMLVDGRGTGAPCAWPLERVRRYADRRRGVGFDQLLVLGPASSGADAALRIFNADGGEAEQCGNGLRCVGRYLFECAAGAVELLTVQCAAGAVALTRSPGGWIRAELGVPILDPERVPFEADRARPCYLLEAAGERVEAMVLSLGNPHAVVRVPVLEEAPVARLGAALGAHPRFPRGVNVAFMQVTAPDAIRLRVYERGAGETPACGSGACAAVVAGRLRGWLAERVRVRLPGGELEVHYAGTGSPVSSAGPAERVYEGRIQA